MRWPTTRAMRSFGPPGGNGTISLIGFDGKSCADAAAEIKTATPTQMKRSTVRGIIEIRLVPAVILA